MFGKDKPLSLAKPEGDDLGRFPAEVDSNPSRSRSQERALRAVSIVAIVSGMMNIATIMLIITLFPLQKVFPYLVTFKTQDNQVVSIEPMQMNAPGMLYATEDAVRDYVVQRHSFTPIEAVMKAQWGVGSRLQARTAPDLYTKFADPARNETTQMMTAGYTRKVDINTVNRINADTWQVEFTTRDTLPTEGGTLLPQGATTVGAQGQSFGQTAAPVVAPQSPVSEQRWVATMRVDYEPQRVTYDKRLINPLGFTVIDYSVSRKN